MEERDPVEMFLAHLEDPSFQDIIGKLIEMLRNLEESGLLDVLVALTQPEVIRKIIDLELASNASKLGEIIDIFTEKLDGIIDALSKDAKPAGLSQVLSSLKDPEVARGLARLVEILRALGK